MTIKEFEAKLQALDPLFTIVQHPNNPELAGVYYDKNDVNKTGFIITVPSQHIEDEFRASYSDETGHPHNWANKVYSVCETHVKRMKEDESYKNEFYEPLYQSRKI